MQIGAIRVTSPIRSRTTPIRSACVKRSNELGGGRIIHSLNHTFQTLTPPPPGNLPRLRAKVRCGSVVALSEWKLAFFPTMASNAVPLGREFDRLDVVYPEGFQIDLQR